MIATRNIWISPLERLYAMQQELERASETAPPNGQRNWVPPMDVVENRDEVLCHLEVPGLSADDIEIRVQDNLLVIAGEKKQVSAKNQQEGGFRSIERHYGSFERSFSLPRTIDTNKVTARHENGVLTIVLPKIEASKPRRIEINGGATHRELNG